MKHLQSYCTVHPDKCSWYWLLTLGLSFRMLLGLRPVILPTASTSLSAAPRARLTWYTRSDTCTRSGQIPGHLSNTGNAGWIQ